MPLEVLYQNLILEHSRNPRNFGKLDSGAVHVRHANPKCGDRLELYVAWSTEGEIHAITFESWGCALSRASASMMSLAVQQKNAPQARALLAAFRALFELPYLPNTSLGDLNAFIGVNEFPARIGCALLPWQALAELLNGSPQF